MLVREKLYFSEFILNVVISKFCKILNLLIFNSKQILNLILLIKIMIIFYEIINKSKLSVIYK